MNSAREGLKNLPGVDKVLQLSEIKNLIERYNLSLVTYVIRTVINNSRKEILSGKQAPTTKNIIDGIQLLTKKIADKSLGPVINASGIIIHTNLGRAPYGENLLNSIFDTLKGYNNLEFNLKKGSRGQRNDHASEILKYLTGAEDVVIVNNNAAAVMFILRTFARNKEAIVSRGELIEIGGSFRIPDIMAASDCKMVEVGATNKTKAQDYEKAITENTALLFKAHQSNYVIKGFTQEVELPELVSIGNKNNIPVVYDIGSGLLRKVNEKALKNEPDVKQALDSGIDMICFSGDKLLGGPQAGIIAGKKKYIDILKKEPMMRALRVGKTTLAILETACSYYLNDKDLFEHNVLFKTLNKSKEEINETAEQLKSALDNYDICSKIVESKGKYGGGTLPDLELESFSVKLLPKDSNNQLAKKLYHQLLEQEQPILSNLKSGAIYFDALTLENRDIDLIMKNIKTAFDQVYKKG
ncbi:MAG: L-seryl-tRNA(Sec) selenium transferase [Bacteroidetes bacterium]|nr:MAG: L-seryl-tRNA(Sec) selenium transferase [Bacteroidota bacterium]